MNVSSFHECRCRVFPQCLNASSFLSSHGMSPDAAVTLADFGFLCPALLSQIDGGACIRHRGPAPDHEETGALTDSLKLY